MDSLMFGGTPMDIPTENKIIANAQGNFTLVVKIPSKLTGNVPVSAGGSHSVYLMDAGVTPAVASPAAAFSVTAGITINPTTGRARESAELMPATRGRSNVTEPIARPCIRCL